MTPNRESDRGGQAPPRRRLDASYRAKHGRGSQSYPGSLSASGPGELSPGAEEGRTIHVRLTAFEPDFVVPLGQTRQ